MLLPLRESPQTSHPQSIEPARRGAAGELSATPGRLACRFRLGGRFGLLVAVEGVGESDGTDIVQVAVLEDVGVDEEGDRHVLALSRGKPLLCEAEALNLVEVQP